MRIDSIIIDHEATNAAYLKKCVVSKFPEIAIHGEASSYPEAIKLIKTVSPTLVFSNINIFNRNGTDRNSSRFEMIYLSDRSEDAINAIHQDACGFILKPFNVNDIVVSVGCAIAKLSQRISEGITHDVLTSDNNLLPHKRLIGIPTIEGFDFVYVHEIIRCEGMQKCTRIVTTRKTNIVSSYCIGEFRRLLDLHGFFSCHKSHLINLMYVRKLTREGFIILTDNSAIPLARRKRLEFLKNLKHL